MFPFPELIMLYAHAPAVIKNAGMYGLVEAADIRLVFEGSIRNEVCQKPILGPLQAVHL